MKTFGEIAYNGYCEYTNWKSLISGADLPKWEAVKPEIKEAWEKAAENVISDYEDSFL